MTTVLWESDAWKALRKELQTVLSPLPPTTYELVHAGGSLTGDWCSGYICSLLGSVKQLHGWADAAEKASGQLYSNSTGPLQLLEQVCIVYLHEKLH